MNRTLMLVLGALGFTLALLIWNHDSGVVAGMESGKFASLVMLGTLLASLIAGGAWYNGTATGALRDVALWLAIFAGLGFLYQASPFVQGLINH
jgi:aspartyl protease family protein